MGSASNGDMQLRPEDKLLLYCAQTGSDPEIKAQIRSICQKGLDWDYLMNKSYYHKIDQLLYWQLTTICPETVPEQVLGYLKKEFKENTRKNLILTGELLKILRLLRSNGILAIPYKGPVLACSAYGNLALRRFSDLDIFVQKEDVLKTEDILTSQGYRPRFKMKNAQLNNLIKFQNEYPFISDNYISIDLHWKFHGSYWSFPIDADFLYDKKHLETIEINHFPILSPAFEDLLLILCIHSAAHFWRNLYLICDVTRLIGSHDMNWSVIMEKAAKLGIKRILFINLLLAVNLLKLKLPDKILDNLSSDKSAEVLTIHIERKLFSEDKYSNRYWKELKLRFNLRENRWNGFKDILVPMINPNLEIGDLALPPFLSPLYYLYRPVYLMKTYVFHK